MLLNIDIDALKMEKAQLEKRVEQINGLLSLAEQFGVSEAALI